MRGIHFNTRKIMAGLSAVALAFGLAGCQANNEEPQAEQIPIKYGYTTNVVAEGYDVATSTPLLAYVAPVEGEDIASTEDASIEEVGEWHVVSVGEVSSIELEEGSYEVSLVSPINADGSIYKTLETYDIEASDIEDAEKTDDIELELIALDQTTSEMYDSILASLDEAKEANVISEDVITLALTNQLANPANASAAEEVVEVVDPETGETSTVTKAEAVASGKKVVSSAPAQGTSTASTSSSSSNAVSNPQTSTSSQSSGSSTPSAPAHVHNYNIKVVDTPSSITYVCAKCGYESASNDKMWDHLENSALSGGSCANFYDRTTPAKVHFECECGARF